MKKAEILKNQRRILCGAVSYSLFVSDGDFSLLAKAQMEGKETSCHCFSLPAFSEERARSFVSALIDSASEPRVIDELIEDTFE